MKAELSGKFERRKNRAFNVSPNIERVKWNLTKESKKVRRGRVFFFFFLNGSERVKVVMMIELNELNGKVERMEHWPKERERREEGKKRRKRVMKRESMR